MDILFATAPILLLIYLMAKPNGVASHKALPFVALVMYGVKLIYFGDDPNLINATVLNGLLSALVPVSIISGAILLFKMMEASGAMDTIRGWLNGISRNRIAQIMIIGWAFSFMIEGASGFGTPAALAGPILVGLGLPAFRVALACLIMNSIPVSFGAVGAPTWFGFEPVLETMTATEQEKLLFAVGFKSAVLHTVASVIIPTIALAFVVKREAIRKNLLFIYLSVASCVVPYFLLSLVSYEFPALVAGMIGFGVTVMLAKKNVGLLHSENPDTCIRGEAIKSIEPLPDEKPASALELAKALFPLWGTVLVLLLTRIRQIGIKDLLTSNEGGWNWTLGSLGEFGISESLVISLERIFQTDVSWDYQLLYVPSIIPFLLISVISFGLFCMKWSAVKSVFTETGERIIYPFIALLGALVYVRLIMSGGDSAVTTIIGNSLANAIGEGWQFFAAFLGALGSFFSGSCTISNLTFGGVQYDIANNLGLDASTILALQSVGGAMGNMVCINNIVAICSILGLANSEGRILRYTAGPAILYGLIVGTVAVCFF